MSALLPIFIIIVAIAVSIIFYFWISKFGDDDDDGVSLDNGEDKYTKAKFITARELNMFNVIKKALPDVYIFIQVSFSALLKNKHAKNRNKYNRLRTDYVVTDKNFKILAVIEIDDKSHIGKEEKDKKRDAMLEEAGYNVLRYQQIPSPGVLKQDVYKTT